MILVKTAHNGSKMTVTVQPLPCNYCVSMTSFGCVCLGRSWPASYWHGSQAVVNSSSCLYQAATLNTPALVYSD